MEIKNPLDRQYRIMSSMILHELEITLGKYVYNKAAEVDFDNPEGLYADIITRIGAVGSIKPSIKSLIEASYLDEIFTLATMQCVGKNEEVFFKYLKQLFAILDVYTIRNCISHPNRVFLPCY